MAVPKLFTLMSTAPPKVVSVAKSIDSPEFRSQRGQPGAYTSWARTEDWTAQTLMGTRTLLDKLDGAVQREGRLTIHERAEHPRRAHIQRIILEAAQIGRGWRPS